MCENVNTYIGMHFICSDLPHKLCYRDEIKNNVKHLHQSHFSSLANANNIFQLKVTNPRKWNKSGEKLGI